MRSQIARLLVCAGIVILMAAGTASASQRVFPDIQLGHWAEKDLAEMKLKGVVAGFSDDNYHPNEPLSREQSVAMLLRVVGLNGVKPKYTLAQHVGNNSIPWHKDVSPWAKEAVAVAWEKGIIPETDLTNFRPKEPCKRHEMTVFAIRAMGETANALTRIGANLKFKDAADIPKASKGYVEVAVNKKIITGYGDNTFKPGAVLNRLHVASILERIDAVENKTGTKTIVGEILVGADLTGTMAIKKSTGGQKVLPLSENAFVYDGRSSVVEQLPAMALMAGQRVEVVLDARDTVVFAEILP